MPGLAFGAAFATARLRRGLAASLAALVLAIRVLAIRVLAVRVLAARALAARFFGGILLDGRLLRRARDFDAMVSVIPAPVNNMACQPCRSHGGVYGAAAQSAI